MPRDRRRDDRRDLRAVPRQGDHGDPSPRARDRARRRPARPVAQPTGHPLGDDLPAQVRAAAAGAAGGGRVPRPRRARAEASRCSGCDVDPIEVFGTNCVKFAGADEDESRPWLARELRIVQPKLVVVMGDDALALPRTSSSSRSRSPVAATLGELQRFTPTIEALVVPDIDSSLDEQPAKTRFWNAFKPVGPWWAELPPY